MFLAIAVPVVVYGALAFTIPEPPRYLVAGRKIPEARRMLSTLVLLGEMFPNRIRAAALAAAGHWAVNWLITVTFPGLREHLGLAYGFYGLCVIPVGPVRVALVRENKGGPWRTSTARSSRRTCSRSPRGLRAVPAQGCAGGVGESQPVKTFDALFDELTERARTRPEGSGTVAALDGGVHGLGKKILEEAGEVWLAAEHESDDALAEEISQLLYWTQVLMIARGLSPDDVYRKL